MLKPLMLLSAAMIAAPVLAQDKSATGDITAGRTPITANPAQTNAAQATPPVADPAQQTGMPSQQAPTAAAPAQTADTVAATEPTPAAQPAAGGDQVAAVVDSEFATYDKNGDGKLSKTEFGGWMVALKTKSDPATKADTSATKTWVAGAFKQADTDKNAAVSKTELTSFLSKGQSQG